MMSHRPAYYTLFFLETSEFNVKMLKIDNKTKMCKCRTKIEEKKGVMYRAVLITKHSRLRWANSERQGALPGQSARIGHQWNLSYHWMLAMTTSRFKICCGCWALISNWLEIFALMLPTYNSLMTAYVEILFLILMFLNKKTELLNQKFKPEELQCNELWWGWERHKMRLF